MTPSFATLQDIQTATNDVLNGFREMAARAEPDIQPPMMRLIGMHERHSRERAA